MYFKGWVAVTSHHIVIVIIVIDIVIVVVSLGCISGGSGCLVQAGEALRPSNRGRTDTIYSITFDLITVGVASSPDYLGMRRSS